MWSRTGVYPGPLVTRPFPERDIVLSLGWQVNGQPVESLGDVATRSTPVALLHPSDE